VKKLIPVWISLPMILLGLSGCPQPDGGRQEVVTVCFQPDGNGDIQFKTNDPAYYDTGWFDYYDPYQQIVTTAAATVVKKGGCIAGGSGLIFCVQDDNDFYRVLITADGYYNIWKKASGSYSEVQVWTQSTNLFTGLDVENTILVEYKGSHNFSLSFNGNHELDFSDPAFTAGRTGFYAYVCSSGYEVFPGNPVDIRYKLLPAGPATGSIVSTLAGSAKNPGYADGVGSSARFNFPNGITTDGVNLYVSELRNHTIRKIAIATREVSTIAGQAEVAGGSDRIGTLATFNVPAGMVVVGGNLYVADNYNHTIRRVLLSTGEVTTFAGKSGEYGNTDAVGSLARFSHPCDVVSDGTCLYVADEANGAVRQVLIATAEVTTLATGFSAPQGLTIDGGNLYVSDTINCAIKRIVISTGVVTTIAGGHWGTDDGIGAAAQFWDPTGIVADSGYLYVADRESNLIRRIVIATGEVSTLAGWPLYAGSSDGTGIEASFNCPTGMAVSAGKLYIADQLNHTIRVVDPSPGPIVKGTEIAPKLQQVKKARMDRGDTAVRR
jgi:hypothetical protein